jgi:glycosyltransferase involved in cell wall biosynthesis
MTTAPTDADGSSQPARVLHVITGLGTGGAERLLHGLVRGLDPARFAVTVVSLDAATGRFAGLLRDDGFEVLGLDRWRRSLRWCAAGLRPLLERLQPDLIHAHLHHANITARLAARRLENLPVISTCQVVEQRFRPWHFWQNAATAADGFAEICVSQAVLEHQVERTGLPESFFRLIPNRVETSRFRAAEPGRDGLEVVALGALRPGQKGFDTLLRAWAAVVTVLPDARLAIVGEGSERGSLEALAAALPDGGASVRLPGEESDVPSLLAGSGIFCVPSRWEGLPLAGMEAMSAGLPIVATDIGPWRELVDQERHGLLVPVDDEAALSTALLRLLRDPQLRIRMGAAARERALAEFDVSLSIARVEALYDEALAARASLQSGDG